MGQALDENSILRFAFETAALNVPAQYGILPDSRVEEIASNLETGGQSASRYIRISGEEWDVLYASDGFGADQELLHKMDETMRSYRIIRQNGHYYVQTGVMLLTLNRILYMETMRDVTEVFDERAVGFSLYRRMTLLILLAGTVIMFLISSWLTKPIRMLTKATKQMADGVRRVSGADIGISTTGIAGPDGGTEEKPVGLVYVGVSSEWYNDVLELRLSRGYVDGAREFIRYLASSHALSALLKAIKAHG